MRSPSRLSRNNDLHIIGEVGIHGGKVMGTAQHWINRDVIAHLRQDADNIVGSYEAGSQPAQRYLILDQQHPPLCSADIAGK